MYDLPGVISPPNPDARQPFSRAVAVPVRPHFGVMGVAPATSERLSSIPPGAFGGNVDQPLERHEALVYTAVAQAHKESVPLFIISSDIDTAASAKGPFSSFHGMEHVRMFQPITKQSAKLERLEETRTLVD